MLLLRFGDRLVAMALWARRSCLRGRDGYVWFVVPDGEVREGLCLAPGRHFGGARRDRAQPLITAARLPGARLYPRGSE